MAAGSWWSLLWLLQHNNRKCLQGQAATTGGMGSTTGGTTGGMGGNTGGMSGTTAGTGMDGGYTGAGSTGAGTTGTTGYTGADTTTTTGATGHTGHHAGEHADFAWQWRPTVLDTLLGYPVNAEGLPSCRWPNHCREGQGNGARNPGDLEHCQLPGSIALVNYLLSASVIVDWWGKQSPYHLLFSHTLLNAAAGEQGGYQTKDIQLQNSSSLTAAMSCL